MFFTSKFPKAVIEIESKSDARYFIGLPDGKDALRKLIHEVMHELILDKSISIPGEPNTNYGNNLVSVKVFPEIGPAFYVGIPKPKKETGDLDNFVDKFLGENFRYVDHWEHDTGADDAPVETPTALQTIDEDQSDHSDKQPEIFVLLSQQDTEEYGCNTSLRFFKSQENARQVMMSIFNKTKDIFNWPKKDDEKRQFYCVITNTSVSVKDGNDSYEWQIIVGTPEDGGVNEA